MTWRFSRDQRNQASVRMVRIRPGPSFYTLCPPIVPESYTVLVLLRPGKAGQRISPPDIFRPILYGGPDLFFEIGPVLPKRIPRSNTSMKNHSVKPEIAGTRSGYVIRFTCPLCNTENSIVNKTPRDHYKPTRDAACSRCRKRIAVTTPAMTQDPGHSPVLLSVKLPVTKIISGSFQPERTLPLAK